MKSPIPFLSCLYFLLISPVFAQHATIAFDANEQMANRTTHDWKITNCVPIPEDENFIYNRLPNGMDYQSILVEKVSRKTGERIWKKKMPFNAYQFKDGYLLSSIQKVGEGYLVFIRRNDSKAKECYLTVQRLNDNMEFVGDEKTIATISTTAQKGNLWAGMLFKVDKMGDYFLISGSYFSAKEPNIIRDFHYVELMDQQLNIVWNKTVDLPHERGYSTRKVSIVGDSQLTILYESTEDPEVLKETKDERRYPLLKATDNGLYIVHYDFQKNLLQSKSILMPSDINYFGRAFCLLDSLHHYMDIFGQYSKLMDENSGQGLFHFRFDMEKMEMISDFLTPFSKEILEQIKAERRKYKEGVYPNTYFIQNVYKTENDKVILVMSEYMEESYNATYTRPQYAPTLGANGTLQPNRAMPYHSASRVSVGKIVHYCNNVFVCQMDSGGTIEWHKQIKKQSDASFDDYIELYSTYIHHTIYLFFNATLKSANQPEDGYEFKGSIMNTPSCLVLLGINQNGVIKVREQFSYGKGNNYDCNILNIQPFDSQKFKLDFDNKDQRAKAILSID
jgi:hypothetical protein